MIAAPIQFTRYVSPFFFVLAQLQDFLVLILLPLTLFDVRIQVVDPPFTNDFRASLNASLLKQAMRHEFPIFSLLLAEYQSI
jgi:hypothetical protein